MKKKIIHKHPLAIRWFHWFNFPILALMIWSGILIYWANDVYKISALERLHIKPLMQKIFDILPENTEAAEKLLAYNPKEIFNEFSELSDWLLNNA